MEDTVFSFISNKRENCFITIEIENLYIESHAAYSSGCCPKADNLPVCGLRVQNYVSGHMSLYSLKIVSQKSNHFGGAYCQGNIFKANIRYFDLSSAVGN